jgi:hypothetical protein
MGSEIGRKMSAELGVVRRIQIRVAAFAANTAVEENGRSWGSTVGQCSPVEAANLALVVAEAEQIRSVWDRDCIGAVVDDGLWHRLVDAGRPVAYTVLDDRSCYTWTGVDMDTDIEIEGEDGLVSGQEMEIVLTGDWVASAASAFDAVEHPFVVPSGREGSAVAREEFAGRGEGVVDMVVVEIRIGGSAVGDMRTTKVAGKMTAAAVVAAADLGTVDGRTEGVVIVKGVEQLVEIVDHAAAHREEGQGLRGWLEHSVRRPLPQRSAESLDFQ